MSNVNFHECQAPDDIFLKLKNPGYISWHAVPVPGGRTGELCLDVTLAFQDGDKTMWLLPLPLNGERVPLHNPDDATKILEELATEYDVRDVFLD